MRFLLSFDEINVCSFLSYNRQRGKCKSKDCFYFCRVNRLMKQGFIQTLIDALIIKNQKG